MPPSDGVVPPRIQRQRTPGWRAPRNAIYVGRGTIWGNDFVIGKPHPISRRPMTRSDVVALYQAELSPEMRALAREMLRGKPLMCWCAADQECHADVLLEVANAGA